MDRELPHVRKKVLETMRAVDRAHWGLLEPQAEAVGASSVEEGEAGRAYVASWSLLCELCATVVASARHQR
eukprot:COSAG02_NODE_65_length_42645_cov_26.951934_6_plen_71_part_00